MTNLLLQAKTELEALIQSALEQCIADGSLPNQPIPSFLVEIPADTTHGDFASNVAMVSARAFRQAPRKIAEAIQAHLPLEGSSFKACDIAGPGFLNFFVSASWFSQVLLGIEQDGEQYGRSNYGEDKKVMVEFVSANPTGPMHIGNARGGALGDCLASVLDWAGYQAWREFYVNDAGNQINKFAISLEARYLQLYQPEFQIPEEAYLGQDIIDHAKHFQELYGDQYVNATQEQRQKALVDYALPLNIQALKDDLEKYRITYDEWFLESSLHNGGEVDHIIQLLQETGYTYTKEDALWFKATEFGVDKDFVLVRANGVPTYVVPDIAYHYNKFVTRNFDRVINIWGADHHGYIPRLKSALQALGVDPNHLDVVLMQMVRLVRDGEIIKASKRSGKAITLVTLLEEVPIDAARFFFNMREANTQMDFDLDLAVQNSSENPVYYVQYAYARICSILDKLETEGVSHTTPNKETLSLLTTSEERELIRYLSTLPNEIIEAAKQYNPSKLTQYATGLATLFHKFYNACRVNSEDAALTQARLTLCLCVKTVLHNVLSILKIDALEKM